MTSNSHNQMNPYQSIELKKVLFSSNKPIILKDALSNWKTVPSNLQQLREDLGHEILDFRLSKSDGTGSLSEGDATVFSSNIQDFLDWANGVSCENNPFSKYSQKGYWAYSSYNYMNQTFSDDCAIMKGIDWSNFGFSGRGGKESVFWIGSAGAYTPCHLDTYGCNLVAQTIGRKQWILFPPSDALYPVRIPYEESSVFSSVDVLNPDLEKCPLFEMCHPHVVTLEPGDVLFIPPRWWHFVRNIDVSVSINTWIELESDDDARLEEAVTAMLMSFFIPAFGVDSKKMTWLNPNQELMQAQEALNCVEQSLERLKRLNSSKTTSDSPQAKIPKLVSSSCSNCGDNHPFKEMHEAEMISFLEYMKRFCPGQSKNIECVKSLTQCHDTKSVINCFVHPDVISCIAQKLKSLNFS